VPTTTGWRRLHPVSPALRSWKVFVALLVIYGQQRGRALFEDRAEAPGLRELLVAALAVVVVVVVASVLGVLSWWMTRYVIDDAAVRLHSGVLFRQQRSAQLDRVQAVDVVRPLVARLLGFAEVRVEVAGGAGSGIRLAYLRRAEAERLQALLLARTGQLPDGDGGADGAAAPALDGAAAAALPPGSPTPVGARPAARPATPVLHVPLGRLVGSVALGTAPLVLLGALVAVVVAIAVSGSITPLIGFGPAVLGIGAGIARDIARGGAWTVERTPVGLRLRHGLLDRRSQTIPRGRVQAVRVSQPPLWRLTSWWKVEVNVAGYGLETDGQQGSSTQVVPVCTRPEVDLLLALVLPEDGPADGAPAPGVVEEGLTGSAPAGWTTSPRRARVLDPVGWRRQGLRAAPSVLLLRRGRLWRSLDVVPHGRTQSLGLVQGPWQRRLRLSSLVVHSTPGPVRPVAPHLDAAEAVTVLLAQAERARAAARLEGSGARAGGRRAPALEPVAPPAQAGAPAGREPVVHHPAAPEARA
jgi:putative membrane protein